MEAHEIVACVEFTARQVRAMAEALEEHSCSHGPTEACDFCTLEAFFKCVRNRDGEQAKAEGKVKDDSSVRVVW